MKVKEQIKEYIGSQAEPKLADMQVLHQMILKLRPNCKLWFLDGKNSEGKQVTNPNVGYGTLTIRYADGSIREFYRVGMTANSAGISIYIMGINDKKFLSREYGKKIGKATVTGYCIRFRRLEDINVDVLKTAIKHRFENE